MDACTQLHRKCYVVVQGHFFIYIFPSSCFSVLKTEKGGTPETKGWHGVEPTVQKKPPGSDPGK